MSWATRKNELYQPAPVLEFWDVEVDDQGTLEHFVDFAEDSVGLLVDRVAFDGANYWPLRIERQGIRQSGEGERTEMSVTVYDGRGGLHAALRAYGGLSDRRVTLRVIPYDLIGDPSVAETINLRIRQPTLVEQGVVFSLAHPNLAEIRIPWRIYTKNRCFNDFTLRFGIQNGCRYPSDDFGEKTRQEFSNRSSVSGATGRLHGWTVVNADKAKPNAGGGGGKWRTGYDLGGTSGLLDIILRIEVDGTDKRWDDGNRLGPYQYRTISGDFDVWTRVSSHANNAELNWLIGLLVQDAAAASEWIYWAAFGDGDAVSQAKVRSRVTTSDLSSETDIATSDSYLRMTRTGSTFKLYSASGTTSSWTLRRTETLSMGASVRIGIATSCDTASATLLATAAEFFRFFSGGETDCNRTLTRCTELGNTIDHNAYHNMPDVNRPQLAFI